MNKKRNGTLSRSAAGSSPRRRVSRWLARRRREGLTFRELSELSGIPAGTLAWWSHKLVKAGDLPSHGGGSREKHSKPGTKLRFVEAKVVESHGSVRERVEGAFEIVAPSGFRLRFPDGFRVEAIRTLLDLVSERC